MSTPVDYGALAPVVSTRLGRGDDHPRLLGSFLPSSYFVNLASRYRTMAGMMVFTSVKAAINAGFRVTDSHYESRPGYFVMKCETTVGRLVAQAIIDLHDDRNGLDAA